jgi:hypothetical protein
MFERYAPEHEVSSVEEPRFTDPAIPSHACCCPARPVVRVIMPPTAHRAHPVDLWLCGHHYRASLQTLLVAGATVEDLTLTPDQCRAHYSGAAAA